MDRCLVREFLHLSPTPTPTPANEERLLKTSLLFCLFSNGGFKREKEIM